ncbi:2-oxoglutarate dehydrogenase, mitochondrial [Phytophthora ramorum]|uniref:2-oxoglutarate dehydrogenase, mitochondrial n=1 Tax=Phytophthora ramorum TaxID=164328 RepID=UPI003098A11E|nr:2-oxoglutarate dehydrogenase, mitochondrial [Phytophthora ramorum]
MHMLGREQCNWIRAKMEHLVKDEESKEKKMHILERLAFSVVFERFLGNKYNTTERFGLDGTESLIPGLKIRNQAQHFSNDFALVSR